MCQLTFANLKNLNLPYMVTQLILNADDNNPDGTGCFTAEKMWKTHLRASLTLNLGDCLKSVIGNEPTVGHVRLATDKTLKDKTHSHPYRVGQITQAHNGKLVPKDLNLDDPNAVDSLVFLEYLDDLWSQHVNYTFPEILVKAMDAWEGKFALMYHLTEENNFYIVRGRTADLFWTTVNGKLVVNTKRDTLDLALHILNNQYQLTHKTCLSIEPIKPVDKESIFRFNPETGLLDKVASIREETPVVKTTTQTGFWAGTGTPVGQLQGVQPTQPPLSTPNPDNKNTLEQFDDLLYRCGLTVEDGNFLCHLVMGCSLLELDHPSLVSFIKDVLEVIKARMNVRKTEIWREITTAGLRSTAYAEGLTFPWMYNTVSELEDSALSLLGVEKPDEIGQS